MLSRISRLSVPLVAAVIAFSPNASAQEPRGAQTSNQVFLPAPRALKQRLARAQKALVEERFSDAVTDLGEVLVTNPEDSETALEMAEQDYFISSSADANVQTSLRAEVVRLIGSLPDKGREIYELQFGVEARTLLNVAVDIGDTSRLSEVIRKYFHTDAGYEAAMVLGRWHLDQNRPLAAALTFRRVLQSPRAAGKFDPELSLLLAASWKYAGQTQNARDVLIDLKRRNPSAKFRLNGERASGLVCDR